MSRTKSTLLELLKEQVEILQSNIIQMDEDSLIKQLAKRKVIYNLTKKSQNQLELVYSYIAISQYYINKEVYQAAQKNLNDSLRILPTGQAEFMLGQIYFRQDKKNQALKHLQKSLQQQWIQPSQQHQTANKLECMTYLQKIYFQRGQKDKLIKLSNQKIKQTQRQKSNFSQKYFYALSMADLSMIYHAFGELDSAIEKISTAITIMETLNESPPKLLQFYLQKAQIHRKIRQNTITDEMAMQNNKRLQRESLFKGVSVIERYQSQLSEQQIVETYEKFIRINVL